MPIVGGWGKYEGRKVESEATPDGWYQVTLGNSTNINRPATSLEIYKAQKDKKHYYVYAYGEEGIPVNFDVFKQRGLGETVRVYFLNLPLYTIGKITFLEDNRAYLFEDGSSHRTMGQTLRDLQNAGTKWGGIKGITPELGYYALLIALSSQAFREVDRINSLVLSPEEKEKRIRQFADTLEDRLRDVIEQAGGKFVGYKKSRGNSVMVTWEIGGQEVKSQINPETLHIVSAGFCLSGDDQKHTMTSIVRLAEVFQHNRPLYITRE